MEPKTRLLERDWAFETGRLDGQERTGNLRQQSLRGIADHQPRNSRPRDVPHDEQVDVVLLHRRKDRVTISRLPAERAAERNCPDRTFSTLIHRAEPSNRRLLERPGKAARRVLPGPVPDRATGG